MPPGQQFHRDDGHAVDFFAAEDVDRVRMTDRRGELPFAEKARAVVTVLQTAAQHLQRDAAPGLEVLGFVDFAHAAAAEQPADAVRPPDFARLQADADDGDRRSRI